MKAAGFIHVEADQYFITPQHELIPEAHTWCQNQTLFLLKKGYNVVVSNTFCSRWEMRPYFNIVKITDASLWIIKLSTQYKSIHNISEEAMERMRNRWEEYDEHSL
jgi:predicted kinase